MPAFSMACTSPNSSQFSLDTSTNPVSIQIRLARAFLVHIPFNRFSLKDSASIFQPVVLSSRAPILECDYNLHKSNSTYFTDLDISRSHLVTCLLGNGINKARIVSKQSAGVSKDRFVLAVGGVTCHFKKEIKPYEAYEVWTRVLCWDEKWLYLVSHFIKAGSVKPKSYTLQPWRNLPGSVTRKDDAHPRSSQNSFTKSPVFASSIAKYVFKRGKVPISPETILQEARLLPPKPDTSKRQSTDTSTSAEASSAELLSWKPISRFRDPHTDEAIVDGSLLSTDGSEAWDWNQIETERTRGMQIAKLFAGLDDLHSEFRGKDEHALAQY